MTTVIEDTRLVRGRPVRTGSYQAFPHIQSASHPLKDVDGLMLDAVTAHERQKNVGWTG